MEGLSAAGSMPVIVYSDVMAAGTKILETLICQRVIEFYLIFFATLLTRRGKQGLDFHDDTVSQCWLIGEYHTIVFITSFKANESCTSLNFEPESALTLVL